MNSKSNLQNALKNAFENHEVPLRESQWHRLEGVLVNTKPKWRIFPFFVAFLLVGITSIATYFLTLKFSIAPISVANETSIPLEDPTNNEASIPKRSIQPFVNAKIANSNLRNTQYKTNQYSIQKQLLLKQGDYNTKQKVIPNASKPSDPVLLLADNSKSTDNTLKEDSEISTNSENTNLIENNDSEPVEESLDSVKPVNDPREKEKEPKQNKPSRMVVSVSAGYSKMNTKIIDIENESMLHKDTRSLFEQSNKDSKSFFFNLGMDYSLLPGLNLGLNTGIQYLRINTPVNVNYRITEVPFYNIDGTILGYYNADSANVIELKTASENISNFINIPLRLNYAIPLNFKNEILLTAGANFMAIVGATGKDVALNESQIKPLSKKTYSQFSAGFLGGVQYSHQLKDPWWLGVETQWSSNKLSFKTGPGSINTHLNGYRLNLILKYKL